MRASFLLSELKVGLRRNVTMTIAVVVTVTVSLAFFGAALLLGKQISTMKGYWYDKVEVSVFLCYPASPNPGCAGQDVTEQERIDLKARLLALGPVEEVFYEDKQQAFERFKEQFAGWHIADSVTADGLQESYQVKLRDPRRADEVSAAMAGQPGVDNVNDQRKILDRLFKVLDGLRILALVLAIAQVIAGMLLIMNTVRLAAFSRRQETRIMRLVGASRLSIQLPFVLQSALAGFVGAVLSSSLLLIGHKIFVSDRLARGFTVTPYINAGAVWTTLPWLFLLGVGLAAIASFLTLRRHIKV